jgi:hypothetical protein
VDELPSNLGHGLNWAHRRRPPGFDSRVRPWRTIENV